MGDFRVQRVQIDVPPSGTTASLGSSVASLSSAFEIVSNNRSMSGGPPGSAATMEVDDMGVTVELTGVGTLTYARAPASVVFGLRTAVDVVEYTGRAGGPNEVIIRGRYSVMVNNGVASTTVTLSGLVDIDRCIPILSVSSEEITDGAARGTAYVVIDSTTQATVHMGGNSGRVAVKFVIVEYTGSNWSVGHGFSGDVSADTGTIALVEEADGVSSGTSFDVGDWATACIFAQHRGDSLSDTNQAIADNWPLMTPGAGTTVVDWEFNSNHDGVTNRHMVHVLQHADMTVQRLRDTQSAQGVMNVTIPSALSDTAQAFTLVGRHSSGGGTAYGRGWVNARITSTTNVELYCHRSGNTILTEVQVVDLAAITRKRRVIVVT